MSTEQVHFVIKKSKVKVTARQHVVEYALWEGFSHLSWECMHVLDYSIPGPYDTNDIFKVTCSKVTVAKTFSKKHFSAEACQLMVHHHRPSSLVFIGLVDHNSVLFCKYKMCTSFMHRPKTGHFFCKHWHEATEHMNIDKNVRSTVTLNSTRKKFLLDMLQFTPRGNSPG